MEVLAEAVVAYISVTEAARRKSVTRQAIYDARDAGKIRSVSILGKIGLDVRDVEAYQPLTHRQHPGRGRKAAARPDAAVSPGPEEE